LIYSFKFILIFLFNFLIFNSQLHELNLLQQTNSKLQQELLLSQQKIESEQTIWKQEIQLLQQKLKESNNALDTFTLENAQMKAETSKYKQQFEVNNCIFSFFVFKYAFSFLYFVFKYAFSFLYFVY